MPVSVGRRRWVAVAGLAVALVLAVGVGLVQARRDGLPGNLAVPAVRPSDATAPWPARAVRPSSRPPAGQPRFVRTVSANGRYFLDQYGDPLLVKGDAPWSLMTDLAPGEVDTYFANREERGFNAAMVSLVGAVGNGAPHDDGSTFDGLPPFAGGDVLAWAPAYWERAHDYLADAARHGITVLLYPIDAWTIGHAFVPTDVEQCEAYGAKVAHWARDLPNIVWMSGGDYLPEAPDLAAGSDVDHCLNAMMRGVRGTGDERLFSIQLGYGSPTVSTGNPYWRGRVDWNFVYTYDPTYRAVLRAYDHAPPIPAVLGEANYERENNQGETVPTTDETLRRQLLWALTSGAAGEFYGSDDWEFLPGWESRLDAPGMLDVSRVRHLVEQLPWWRLVPDEHGRFLVGGRGTPQADDNPQTDVLDSDYATAAISPDGTAALVYVPTPRTVTIDPSLLAPGVRVSWVDPSSGAETAAGVHGSYTSPGPNADGDGDWVLVVRPPVRR